MSDMNRNARALMAKQTVAICESGFYQTPAGKHVQIAEDLAKAKAGTVLHSPENPPAARATATKRATRVEVRNETTFQALSRLAASERHVACLNFASAKNPGGGFLNGSMAQEESLAIASGLYSCLVGVPEFYSLHRAHPSALYLDQAIFSPRVPFFRNDAGLLLENVVLASVITAAAPNAGAVQQNEPDKAHLIKSVLRQRAELVLSVACAHQVDQLVLGAWGCGVFRNDPRIVAGIFAALLLSSGKFEGIFSRIVFAVYDRAAGEGTFKAFAERFASAGR